ncbi:MAG: ABC transporter ATP-binding protein [Planctomycetaceae bacterium]
MTSASAGSIANSRHANQASGGVALSVRNLTTRFRTDRGLITAVSNVSFDLFRGESLGIVGESGCGKSVTCKSVMRLLPEHVTVYDQESQVLLDGENLLGLSDRRMRDLRGNRIAMIFQEPMTALNPVFTIGWQLDEALRYHTRLNRRQRRERVLELLDMVEIPSPANRYRDYPHQLSGGMRQRVMIAMALACEPKILIADEPTTALDVTIQAQILKLMNDLRQRTGTSVMLITHDMGVVAQTCDRVVVMYAGQVVEQAPVMDLFHNPAHPYTKALLDSIPRSGGRRKGQRLATIPGLVPALTSMPAACRFADRCPLCQARCESEMPLLERLADRRTVRCHFPVHKDRRPTG